MKTMTHTTKMRTNNTVGYLDCLGQVLVICLALFVGSQGTQLAKTWWPGPMKTAMRWFYPLPSPETFETHSGVDLTV